MRPDDGWVIADLGSPNGVKVNGKRTPEARLEPGDDLMIGLVRLKFELE